jgi:hypothetical protein
MSLIGDGWSIWYRVEDQAVLSGLNGFHMKPGELINGELFTRTVPDLFDKVTAAIDFAKFCQRRFPDAQMVVSRFGYVVDDDGAIEAHSERVWP